MFVVRSRSLAIGIAILVVLQLPLKVAEGANVTYAYKLMQNLLQNYSVAVRPSMNLSNPIQVKFGIALSQIIDMDERNQILTAYVWLRMRWNDCSLKWNPAEYDGLAELRIPSTHVWKPDIVLYNNADDQFTSRMETNVVLSHTGDIYWDSPAITKSSCEVDVSYFPFDYQNCRVTFGSWTYTIKQLEVVAESEEGDLQDYIPNVEWDVLGMPASRNLVFYGCCPDPFPDMTYSLKLQRKSLFYIINLIVPCVLISLLAPFSFYLPANSGEKVSLGVTVLLALTVFQLLVAESMPPSENIPLIGKYYIVTMTLMSLSTAMTIFVMNVHHCGPDRRPVPRWVRRLFLDAIAPILVGEAGGRKGSVSPSGTSDTPVDTAEDTVQTVMEECELRNQKGHMSNGVVAPAMARNLPRLSFTGFDTCKTSFMPDDVLRGRNMTVDASTTQSALNGLNKSELSTIAKNVECVAAYIQERAQEKEIQGDWAKVAKVIDRIFMWIFIFVGAIISILILTKVI
ncbi:CHRNA9 [Branchiostoma lanceolatum]|uniref:CHRNA9 protein n=1 Tax=Branchiostoma lanceolatum TaxID=7740 RepID=A0A8K0A379_BRALA|nr:CHRNA9 [Branchiostoma lanceolatum]